MNLMSGNGHSSILQQPARSAHLMESGPFPRLLRAICVVRIAAVRQRGSEHRDELTPSGFATNHAGGILGGISSGQDIVVHMALKPTSSIQVPGKTVNVDGEPVDVVTTGRHDPCVGLRATPIAEAMLALVLMDHYLRHRGQNADVISSTPVLPGSTAS